MSQGWEYTILYLNEETQLTLITDLNELGSMGWELVVSHHDYLILKRPR